MKNIRNNSFDVIRHIAALSVLLSHSAPLSGQPEPMIDRYHSLGNLAVLAFFAISGFLIPISWRANAGWPYFKKRIAQLFPALILCAFVMVYLLAPWLVSDGFAFITNHRTFFDFLKICTFGRAYIDGVTDIFIFKDSLNGSLWTLKFEFLFYFLVAIFLKLNKGRELAGLVVIAGVIATFVLDKNGGGIAYKLVIYSSVAIAFFPE